MNVNKRKEFDTPIYREVKKEKLGFTIKTAELKKEIRVKDQTRKAREDKLYLLLRIELENNTPKRLTFATPDYVRLVAKDDKKYAPDYHNGTVIVDPLSIKNDLIAFSVDKNQKQVSFLVGDLEGEKEKIDIKF